MGPPIDARALRVVALPAVGAALVACTTVPAPTTTPAPHTPTGSAATSTPTPQSAATIRAPTVLWRIDGVLPRCCFNGYGSLLAAFAEVVLVADGYEGSGLTALDITTGAELWSVQTGGATVFVGDVDNDTVLVHGQYGWLAALNIRTGAQRWRIELDDERYGVAGAVLLRNQAVITTATPYEGDERPPYVFLIDVNDGQASWRTDLEPGSEAQWAPPVLHGTNVFVQTTPDHPGSATNVLHALDINTGRQMWSTGLGGDQGFFETPPVITGDIIVARGQRELHGIATADGEIVWSTPAGWPLWARHDGTVVLAARSQLVAVHAADGTHTETIELSGQYDPASVAPDTAGHRIVLATPQAVLTLRRSSADLIWRHRTDTPPAEIAASNTTVVVMYQDGSVAALGPDT